LEEVDDGHAVVGGDEDSFGHESFWMKSRFRCKNG
jgi:hypothetical protein